MHGDLTKLSLSQLASIIRADWDKPYFGAVQYLQAMGTLEWITDCYGYDSGKEIVIYFLANATRWKGENARKVKAELKRRVNELS